LQAKFKIEQEIEKVSLVLNEKHLELLELLFPGWSRKFENVKSRILTENVTRVQITFKWKIKKNYSSFEINIKVCEHYLLFSLKTNKYLNEIFEKDFDIIKLADYLEILGIKVQILSVSSSKPKNGTNGQQHTEPNHKSNGQGKLPRSQRVKNGKIPWKKKKKI
jgi:hypothetical protein